MASTEIGPHFHLELELGCDEAALQEALPAEFVRRGDFPTWGHRDDQEFAFLEVRLDAGVVTVTRGWRGGEPGNHEVLAERLLALLGPLGLWEVSAGGEGYGTCFVRAGTGEASLRAYCAQRRLDRRPHPSAVQLALEDELAASGLIAAYAVGEWEDVEERRLRVALHHRATRENIPTFEGEFEPLARALTRRCDVAVSAAVGDPHRPWPRPAGHLKFGL